jgi:hypothetical protein
MLKWQACDRCTSHETTFGQVVKCAGVCDVSVAYDAQRTFGIVGKRCGNIDYLLFLYLTIEFAELLKLSPPSLGIRFLFQSETETTTVCQ